MSGRDPSASAATTAGPAAGSNLHDGRGRRVVAATAEMIRSVRFVLEKERGGSWGTVMKSTGRACGRAVAAGQDAHLLKTGRPVLAAQPLEASIGFLVSHFAEYGWGHLVIDLSAAAEHGLILGRLSHSSFAAALAEPGRLADPFAAGVLLGYFEHITGQSLACEEIACSCQGAPHCTFAVSTPDRLAPVTAAIGTASAEQIVARLKTGT